MIGLALYAFVLTVPIGPRPPSPARDCSVIGATGTQSYLQINYDQASKSNPELISSEQTWGNAASSRIVRSENGKLIFDFTSDQGSFEVDLNREIDGTGLETIKITKLDASKPFPELEAVGLCKISKRNLAAGKIPLMQTIARSEIKAAVHAVETVVKSECQILKTDFSTATFDLVAALPRDNRFEVRVLPKQGVFWTKTPVGSNGMMMPVFAETATTPVQRSYDILGASILVDGAKSYSLEYRLEGPFPRGWVRLNQWEPSERRSLGVVAVGMCTNLRRMPQSELRN